MPKGLDLTGQRFEHLLVIERGPPLGRRGRKAWRCLCDCGQERLIATEGLRSGHNKSCGCRRGDHGAEQFRKHGKSRTREHNIWLGIIARCRNPNVKAYPHYGGRGITICARWLEGDGDLNGLTGFECFLADVGPSPSLNHSIERKNSNGNYEPGNVHWAEWLEQANNKRNTRRITYRGQEMSLCNAVRLAGSLVHYEAAWVRIKSGWTVEQALETPRLFESHGSKNHRSRKAAGLGGRARERSRVAGNGFGKTPYIPNY